MIQIAQFTFNPFQENTYLLFDEDLNAILIDPGMYDAHEQKLLNDFIRGHELVPKQVVLTHAHLDHIFGLKAFLDEYDVPFFIHEKELPVYENAAFVASNYGVRLSLPTKQHECISEKDVLNFGGQTLAIRFTPGHSPGSICIYSSVDNWVISGDVIFQQSIGRTDLPGGDTNTLLQSIQTQIFTLPPETKIYSGHGPATSVGIEKMNNPFFH